MLAIFLQSACSVFVVSTKLFIFFSLLLAYIKNNAQPKVCQAHCGWSLMSGSWVMFLSSFFFFATTAYLATLSYKVIPLGKLKLYGIIMENKHGEA